jgi:hypothetical protein
MNRLPAITGWHWVKEGFAIFRKQPMALSTLFLSYLFMMLAIGIIPVLGQIMPLVLLPVFSLAFLRASAQVKLGEQVSPALLFAAFRSPALKRLLLLGAMQLAVTIAILAVSALIDGGVCWKVLSGQTPLDATILTSTNMSLAMLVSALLYVPATMAFWYAAPLVAWHEMGIGKAMFYSFFAMQRQTRAFLIYSIGWGVLFVIVPTIISLLLALLLNSAGMIVAIMMPLTLLLTVVLYCSFYVTYTDVFGTDALTPKIDLDV